MTTLTDSIEIKATPKKVFDWFMHFAENYKAWHPEHGECRWLKGKAFEAGSILYSEEYLHGKLHKF
ncbi:MAG: SRPBCC family protein [Candidatus Hodarchaeota archaeon]